MSKNPRYRTEIHAMKVFCTCGAIHTLSSRGDEEINCDCGRTYQLVGYVVAYDDKGEIEIEWDTRRRRQHDHTSTPPQGGGGVRMNDTIYRQGRLCGDKVQYPDGIGCCVWYPFDNDPTSGFAWDFPAEDIDDLIALLQTLKAAPAEAAEEG